jgi:hypothetical protein
MTSPEMIRSSTSFGRPIWRLLLTVALGLALASRLALGATVPMVAPTEPTPAADAIARLQAVMVMCAPGQNNKRPPSQRHTASFDDLLVFEQADNLHALPGSPPPSPLAVSAWTTVTFQSVSWAKPPKLCRAAWQARGPPAVL